MPQITQIKFLNDLFRNYLFLICEIRGEKIN